MFRVAIKPVSSIAQKQHTLSYGGEESALEIKGRHDPCVLPRAPPLVESMTALVIADLSLRQRGRVGPRPLPVLSATAEKLNHVTYESRSKSRDEKPTESQADS